MSNSQQPPEVQTKLRRGSLYGGDLTMTLQKTEAHLVWKDKQGLRKATVTSESIAGSSPDAPIWIRDPTVSRVHMQIEPRADGVYVRDLKSKNGIFKDGDRLYEATVRDGARLLLGETEVIVRQAPAAVPAALWPQAQFGRLLGRSPVMRDLFVRLADIARADGPVLIHGETGTGKELVAQAIHERSERRDGPYEIFDCTTISEHLVESELFGHTRGAFTGATSSREGAFLRADGGTLFLDEIAEIPLQLQSKLLRAIESGQVRRLGEDKYRKVNVRVIAASHQDLGAMAAARTFREDLYFRLHVLLVEVPPLRQRREDIMMLVQHFLPEAMRGEVDPGVERELFSREWDGNVRDVRNFVEQWKAFGLQAALAASPGLRNSIPPSPAAGAAFGASGLNLSGLSLDGTLGEVRSRVLEWAEREYVQALLAQCDGDVRKAAEIAGVSARHLWRLVSKYHL